MKARWIRSLGGAGTVKLSRLFQSLMSHYYKKKNLQHPGFYFQVFLGQKLVRKYVFFFLLEVSLNTLTCSTHCTACAADTSHKICADIRFLLIYCSFQPQNEKRRGEVQLCS